TVLDAQLGKLQPPGLAGGGVYRSGAAAALAAAQRVHADHEPAIGVDRLARAEHGLPPAGLGILRMAGGVGAGRKAGEDEDGVVAGGVEPAPGLVGHAAAAQLAAALEHEGRGQFDVTGGGRDELRHSTSVAMRRVAAAPSATSSSTGAASRSPGAAAASPLREIRASRRTRACCDSDCAGIRPSASDSDTVTGKPVAGRRLTATGRLAPSTVRAKTYSTSSPRRRPARAGSSCTVTVMAGPAAGAWPSASGGRPARPRARPIC